MIPLQKWLAASFTTLVDAELTTNGRWITIHDWTKILLHYFDYGQDIQFDKDQLLRAIKSIDGRKILLHVSQGNDTGIHLCDRTFKSLTGRRRVAFIWASHSDRSFQPPVCLPKDQESWDGLPSSSSTFISEHRVPSFRSRSLRNRARLHEIDLEIQRYRREHTQLTKVASPTRPPNSHHTNSFFDSANARLSCSFRVPVPVGEDQNPERNPVSNRNPSFWLVQVQNEHPSKGRNLDRNSGPTGIPAIPV
jgi:hypothetical protein